MSETLNQERVRPADLFPKPEPDEFVEVNPPAFNWLPVEGAEAYRVIVENAAGETVVDETVDRNALLLRRTLPAGKYRWDLESGGLRRGWWDFEISPDAAEQIVPTAREVLARVPDGRPRHLYYPEDIASVVAAHPRELEVLKRNIEVAIADGLPERPVFHREADAQNKRLAYRAKFGGPHRDAVDRNLVACALGHLLLRDERAGKMAREILLEICDWSPEGPCAVDGPWGDEIGLSHARCLPAVIDWTWDLFDDAERLYLTRTLAIYARQVLRRLRGIDFFSHPGNSHCGRIPAYLGEAAMVLKGCVPDAEAEEWLQYALDIYGSFFPFYGGRDGGWAEGVFYGSSYTKWYLPFFLAVERHSGFSFLERTFYRRVSQYFMHFAPPGWEIHPFCDGYYCLPDSEEWPGFFAQNPFRVYAERFGPPLARRFLEEMPQPEIYKLHLLDVFTRPVANDSKLDAGPAENCRVFRDAGFVSMHSDIESPAEDTALLARASRFGTASHQHADQGGFAIISRERGLVSPTGYFGAHWSSNHHAGWSKRTKAHNAILVNGEGEQPNSHLAVGRIVSLDDSGDRAVAVLDLDDAYTTLTHWRRTLAMVRPGLIVVADDIAADKEVAVSWLMHTLSPPKVSADAVRVVRDPASLDMYLFTTDGHLASPEVSDVFDPGVNDGVPEKYHVERPTQYHLRWDAPAAMTRRFVGVFAVNGAEIKVAQSGDAVAIHYGERSVECSLAAGGEPVRFV